MNYPNKIQSRPSLAADQPILGVPVPNYNTQRPRGSEQENLVAMGLRGTLAQSQGGGSVKSESKPTGGGTDGDGPRS